LSDRAIQRVINQQKFHHRFLATGGNLGLGKNLHPLGHRCCTGRQWLRHFLHLDHAHATVGRDRQFLVVTKTRHGDPEFIGHLDYHGTLACLAGLAIDFNIDGLVSRDLGACAHAAAPFESAPAPTMQHLCSM
jgi:hypothetical protein